MDQYVNVSWSVPQYALESTIAHSDDPVAVCTNVLVLLCVGGTWCAEAYRRGCFPHQHRSFLSVITCMWMATALRLVDATQRSDAIVVTAWAMDVMAASCWLVAMLNRKEKTLRSLGGSLLLGVPSVLMVALFLPTHVVHHVSMVALSQAALVVAMSVPNPPSVRWAAAVFVASHFGTLFWDVPSPDVEHTDNPVGLYLFTMFTTQLFMVCVLLSFRSAVGAERSDSEERARMIDAL